MEGKPASMSSQTDLSRISVVDFAERFRGEMVPLSNTFSYFSALPLSEEEVKEYLEEPLAALPPSIRKALPKTSLLLVPYLEKASGKIGDTVLFEAPPDNQLCWSARLSSAQGTVVVLPTKALELGDYHYQFYYCIAELMSEFWSSEARAKYCGALREELSGRVHGEVDDRGWRLKQALMRRQTNLRRETKGFQEYATQSFIDTLALYLHGLCCDIDVETGPRQLPSRYLRRRLLLLEEIYPPPEKYTVFPEAAGS
jgi:hypothetical protein